MTDFTIYGNTSAGILAGTCNGDVSNVNIANSTLRTEKFVRMNGTKRPSIPYGTTTPNACRVAEFEVYNSFDFTNNIALNQSTFNSSVGYKVGDHA